MSSAATAASIRLMIRSASASWPWRASQRGDSGTRNWIQNTTTAPTEPISTTQRQPSKPNGLYGTSSQPSSATTGTAQKVMNWLAAKARPRSRAGISSEM